MTAEKDFEDAIRYVFDQCGRGGGPNNSADTDVFNHAMTTKNWGPIRAALAKSIERIVADASGIQWSASDKANGGVEPNLTNVADRAKSIVQNASSPAEFLQVISLLVHALKAAVLKADGNIPPAYKP